MHGGKVRLAKRYGRRGRTISASLSRQYSMTKKNVWADKVCALVQSGNTGAALAQMRVAPDPQDLKRLRALLERSGFLSQYPALGLALDDHLTLLSSPRLHRAP